MVYKNIDGYHDNKDPKSHYFDDSLVSQAIPNSYMRLFGMEIEVETDMDYRCPTCNGRGEFEVENECYNCDGRGVVEDEITCPNCDGGHIMEMQTDDEGNEIEVEIECPDCDGSGYIMEEQECPTCEGSCYTHEMVECEDCDGRGNSDSEGAEIEVPDELEDTFVLETDGSLSEGYEIITEPMTAIGITKWLENDWLRQTLRNCSVSRSTRHAGVHIHMSKPDGNTIKKLLVFFTLYGKELAQLTRDSSYASFSTINVNSEIYGHFLRIMKELPDDFQTTDSHEDNYYKTLIGDMNLPVNTEYFISMFDRRHIALNLTNDETVEFRFFNFTDDYKRLQTYIRFLDSLMDILDTLTLDEVISGEFIIYELDNLCFFPNPEIFVICVEKQSEKQLRKLEADCTILNRYGTTSPRNYSSRRNNSIEYRIGQYVILDTELMRLIDNPLRNNMGYDWVRCFNKDNTLNWDLFSNDNTIGKAYRINSVYDTYLYIEDRNLGFVKIDKGYINTLCEDVSKDIKSQIKFQFFTRPETLERYVTK